MAAPRASILNVNDRLKTALLSLDVRLQPLVSLKAPLYTEDENLVDGAGVYSAGDWSHTRRRGSARYGTDGTQYDSDAQFEEYIGRVERAKIESVVSLLEAFDFGRFPRIFELGCGDMIQAQRITRRCPEVAYVASDFDPYVIERCDALPMLSGIRKRVFDVLTDPHDAFAEADLLLSWGLDAALEDAQLIALLESVRRLRVPYLMCSPTVIGPLVFAHQWSASAAREKRLAGRSLRMHGWARSVAYFRKLARLSGVRVRTVGRHGLYTCLMFGESRGV